MFTSNSSDESIESECNTHSIRFVIKLLDLFQVLPMKKKMFLSFLLFVEIQKSGKFAFLFMNYLIVDAVSAFSFQFALKIKHFFCCFTCWVMRKKSQRGCGIYRRQPFCMHLMNIIFTKLDFQKFTISLTICSFESILRSIYVTCHLQMLTINFVYFDISIEFSL